MVSSRQIHWRQRSMHFSSSPCPPHVSRVCCGNANMNKVTRWTLVISLYEQFAAVFVHVETVCCIKGRADKQNRTTPSARPEKYNTVPVRLFLWTSAYHFSAFFSNYIFNTPNKTCSVSSENPIQSLSSLIKLLQVVRKAYFGPSIYRLFYLSFLNA